MPVFLEYANLLAQNAEIMRTSFFLEKYHWWSINSHSGLENRKKSDMRFIPDDLFLEEKKGKKRNRHE